MIDENTLRQIRDLLSDLAKSEEPDDWRERCRQMANHITKYLFSLDP